MCFKIVWVLAGILLFVFAPLKVFSNLDSIGFVESGWFTALFFGIIMAILLLIKFSKVDVENLKVKRNIPLAIISVLVAASFFFCISTYYNDKSLYDFEWQPVMMAILSILACLTFVIMAVTLLTGKNLFSFLSFFIFCPVFWFSFDMILFLSIQNDNSDIYDITLTAFSALFFLYYTQVFSTSSNLNILKLIIGFGIPTVILSFMKSSLIAINYSVNPSLVSKVELSTVNMQFFVAIYIIFVLIDAVKEMKKSKIGLSSNSQKI